MIKENRYLDTNEEERDVWKKNGKFSECTGNLRDTVG